MQSVFMAPKTPVGHEYEMWLCIGDHATSGCVFEIASKLNLTAPAGPVFRPKSISGLYQGSPPRQKQSNYGHRLGSRVGYPEQRHSRVMGSRTWPTLHRRRFGGSGSRGTGTSLHPPRYPDSIWRHYKCCKGTSADASNRVELGYVSRSIKTI